MKDFSIPISSYLNFFPRDYEENFFFFNFIYLFFGVGEGGTMMVNATLTLIIEVMGTFIG